MRDRSCASGGVPVGRPSDWVARFYPGIKAAGRVLDVACGGGRHFALGLTCGNRIVGIDRDLVEARRHWAASPTITLIEADLEDGSPWPFRGQAYDGVIVTNYLWRPILPDIIAAIAPDGLLIYETFMAGQAHYGRPSNPDFLLRPGELLAAVQDKLKIVAFEHVLLTGPDRVVQRIAAAGPAHRWPGEDLPSSWPP